MLCKMFPLSVLSYALRYTLCELVMYLLVHFECILSTEIDDDGKLETEEVILSKLYVKNKII